MSPGKIKAIRQLLRARFDAATIAAMEGVSIAIVRAVEADLLRSARPELTEGE